MPLVMKMRHAMAVIGLAFCLIAVSGGAGNAQERIHAFNATIEIAADGTLTVTETIRVRAEGDQIRRGIFRDIPLAIDTPNGRILAGFDLLSVTRDGEPDGYRVNRGGGGVRIYIGREEVFLTPGDYTYKLVYETTRQIRFFEGYDEVFWNVTGNEWIFPIDTASARVVLPDGAVAQQWTAYTGFFGEQGSDVTARTEDAGNSVVFSTTRPLAAGEGLSVVVAMEKGVVAPPTEAEQRGYFLQDNMATILGGGGVLLVLVYYFGAWWLVGRDPPRGVVFPRFEAPEGVSPALAAYIHDKGFGDGGWKALSAACLNLAVHGRMKMEDFADDLTLSRPEQEVGKLEGLPKGEAAIARWFDARNSSLTLSKANGTSVVSLGKSFRGAIEGENRGQFFKENRLYLIPGIGLSVVTIIALVVFGNLSQTEIGALFPSMMAGFVISIFSVRIAKSMSRARGIVARVGLAIAIFTLVMALGIAGFAVISINGEIPYPVMIAAGLFSINALFFFLIGAPTAVGRTRLDEIEGLNMYLSVAEKDRMNMAGAPEMSPRHFETLLPYAVALNVEKPWSKAFEAWLTTAAGAAVAASYSPTWYSGRHFDSRHVSSTLGKTVSAMSGGFSSSVPAPKSSSSGFSGGGSSGGGGGGGGGGGW
ncbi:DUF2207 domain-containing protein [Stappia sp. ES.058]|uniref:DUF2207 domain-containing protein n=1 Tax=Stappia sp. ES.058 TaxID=1881061 RepID=UPI00087B26E3|nr:DUF2207 domain-containing protein [Stappia sp. ES.058]SDT92628.1 Predicted membrane protein [Stappia sp. ES.058]